MAKSGNPAKAAQQKHQQEVQQVEERAVRDVVAAVNAGRNPTIPVTPDTTVVLRTTNADEAEFITRAIMLLYKYDDGAVVESVLSHTENFMHLWADMPQMRKTIALSIERMQQIMDTDEEWLEANRWDEDD